MADRSGEDSTEALKSLVDRMMARMQTAIPAIVKEFDSSTQLMTVEPAIRKFVTIDGEKSTIEIPPIIKVPISILYAQNIGFSITQPYQPGDEILLVTCRQSIDQWVDSGGKQNPIEPVISRHHQITDSIAIVGVIPGNWIIPDYSTDSTDVRNRDRTTRISQYEERIENERIGDSQTAFYRLKEDEIYAWVYDQSAPMEGHVTIRKDEINAQVTNDAEDAFLNIKSTDIVAEITDGSSTANVNMQPELIDADTTDGTSTATINMVPSQIESTVEGASGTATVLMDETQIVSTIDAALGTGELLLKGDQVALTLNSAPFMYEVKMQGGELNIEISGIFGCSINLNSNTGILTINADTYIELNGIIWDTHQHTGVFPGAALTGPPV